MLFLGLGNVYPQADAPAIRGQMIAAADPAAIAQQLFMRLAGVAVLLHAYGQPILFTAHGIGVLAMGQTVAQDILELGTGNDCGG